jgi:hypothetical protein
MTGARADELIIRRTQSLKEFGGTGTLLAPILLKCRETLRPETE